MTKSLSKFDSLKLSGDELQKRLDAAVDEEIRTAPKKELVSVYIAAARLSLMETRNPERAKEYALKARETGELPREYESAFKLLGLLPK
ncbi:MAG TPA: hypothetical protein VE986_01715 [Hyphomicrobiales bacterium]|nr:hypothetical protein [Hyphomicrobiales bacterium]